MNQLLEFFPLLAFFGVYSYAGIYWATGTLILTSILQILVLFLTKKPIHKRTWIPAVLMVVMGGLTIYMQNDAFLKWKFTVIYILFAIVLLISDIIFKNNLIKKLLNQSLGEELSIPNKTFRVLNISWSFFFASLAVLNIYIAYNFSLDTWVQFKVFWATGLMFVFMILNMVYLYKYLPKEDNKEDESTITNLETNDK